MERKRKEEEAKKKEEETIHKETTTTTPTRNRYDALEESRLDEERNEEMEIAEDQIEDMLAIWDNPLPQRSKRELNKSPGRRRSGDSNKRMLEDTKSPKSTETSPTQINKKMNKDNQEERNEGTKQTVFQIPTITSNRNITRTSREDSKREQHIQDQTKPRETSHERNQKMKEKENEKREKIRDASKERQQKELEKREKKREESKERQQEREKEKHEETCGCFECFLDEALAYEKLDEKKVTKLIYNFMDTRKPETVKDVSTHEKDCCCVIHLEEKIMLSKKQDKTIQDIISTFNMKYKNRKEKPSYKDGK